MVWGALLGACVTYSVVEFGRISAQHQLEMDPQDESTCVLLSKLQAITKRWEPGLSWIENQSTVHYYISRPDMRLINEMLEWLKMRTLKAGHVPNCNVVMLDVENDEKECLLFLGYWSLTPIHIHHVYIL